MFYSVKTSVLGTGTPMVSSKVVQPTATVSSVPVSGPSKNNYNNYKNTLHVL